jgi:hypothetical protein
VANRVASEPVLAATYSDAMLHPDLMSSIVSRIGQDAGLSGPYWKGGVFLYETATN